MKKILSILAILYTCLLVAGAQEKAPFTADRPGVSTGPAIVGLNVLQIEQGFGYNHTTSSSTFTFSNTLLRFGLFQNTELRIGGDGILHKDFNYGTSDIAFTGINIGTKISCFEGRGAIPAISVLADLSIPGTATKEYGTQALAPSLYLLFENFITEWLYICYNIGTQWDGSNPYPSLFLAASVGADITDKIGIFAESYNNIGPTDNNYAVDFGLYWSIARRLQIDISADLNLKQTNQNWGLSLGLAWQFNK